MMNNAGSLCFDRTLALFCCVIVSSSLHVVCRGILVDLLHDRNKCVSSVPGVHVRVDLAPVDVVPSAFAVAATSDVWSWVGHRLNAPVVNGVILRARSTVWDLERLM